MNITSDLVSKRPLERQAAYDVILRQRDGVIRQLLAILDNGKVDKSYQGGYHRAITLLGKLRAKEAVKPLAGIMEYIPDAFESEEVLPSEAYYVAAVALIDIGQPAIPLMLETIKTSKSSKQRDIAAWVIMEIEGKAQALNRIQTAIENKPKEASQGMHTAKEYIANYKATFGHPMHK